MIEMIALTGTSAALFTLFIVVVMFTLFLRETYPVGALVRTGALAAMTEVAERQAATNPARAIGGALLFVAFASAIMNNTPLVVVMIPGWKGSVFLKSCLLVWSLSHGHFCTFISQGHACCQTAQALVPCCRTDRR